MLSNPLDFEKPIAELDSLIAELKQVAKDPHVREDAKTKGIDIEIQIAELESRREQLIRQIFSDLTPWNQVQMARHPQRPRECRRPGHHRRAGPLPG